MYSGLVSLHVQKYPTSDLLLLRFFFILTFKAGTVLKQMNKKVLSCMT